MTQVAVRKATSADAQAITEHIKRVLREPGVYIPLAPDELEEEHLYEIAESDNSVVLLAEAQGQIIGILECKGGGARPCST